MTRGEIWTVSGAGYAGKPRPAIIVQDDRFDGTESVTVCVFTTDETEAPLFRVPIAPSARNGLREASRVMVDNHDGEQETTANGSATWTMERRPA